MNVEKILLIQEKNCKIPKRFSQKFTPDHLERLITESTTFKELIEKSVIYYSLWDTLMVSITDQRQGDIRIHGKKISLQHMVDLLEKVYTNVRLKHLNLDNRTNMNVKQTEQLMQL